MDTTNSEMNFSATQTSTEDSTIYADDTTIANESDKDDYYELYGFVLADKMYPIHTFIFFIVGTIGNMIALLVIMQKNMRNMSSSMFIATLSVADTISLAGFVWGMALLIYTPSAIKNATCKAFQYTLSAASMISTYTVIAMSFERLLIVSFPLKAPNWTSRKRALITIATYTIAVLLFNAHMFWTAVGTDHACDYDFERYGDLLKKLAVVDACITTVGPLIIIFIINSIIIMLMKRASNIQRSMSNNPAGSSKSTKASSMNATNQITIMLLSVSITFFLCMSPWALYQIYTQYILDPLTISNEKNAEISVANQFCILFWEINHSINLILYSLTGRKFRNELICLFGCGRMVAKPRSSTYALGVTQTTVSSIASKVSNDTNGQTSGNTANSHM